jgi:hypothetical protein
MDARRDETERFFRRIFQNAANGNETPLRVQSHSPEDPQWITNVWGAKNIARKRLERDFYDAEEAVQWVLVEKHGRFAIVPSAWKTVVKIADSEAVDRGLEDPAACRLAFFGGVMPSFVVAHREGGTLHAVWLSRFLTTRSLSDRFARRLKGRTTKRIPVPGTRAQGGHYKLIETGPVYDVAELEAGLRRTC